LFTIVFLRVGFLFYKHLLHYEQNGSCPVTGDTMVYLLVIRSYGTGIQTNRYTQKNTQIHAVW